MSAGTVPSGLRGNLKIFQKFFSPNLTGEYVSRIEKNAVEKLRAGMECAG